MPVLRTSSLWVRFVVALLCASCGGNPESTCEVAEGESCGAKPDPKEMPCAAGTRLGASGGCTPVGWQDCGEHFRPDPSGWGCEPVPATEAGALGWTACPRGFYPDASGWGCRALLSTDACTGATFERIGEVGCVPVSDCSLPFPPAKATHFVDDDYAVGDIDATHFATLIDALASAPTGAVIAIEAGTYVGALGFPRDVELIGRCAAQVSLVGGGTSGTGLEVNGVTVAVTGVSVTGFTPGVLVEAGGSLELGASVIEANVRAGLLVADAGSVAHLSGCVIRGTLPDGTGKFGHGAAVGYGAALEVVETAIVGNREMGVLVFDPGSTASLDASIIRDTLPRQSTNTFGWGIGVQEGGKLSVGRSAILDNRAVGVNVRGDSSVATLDSSEVSRTKLGKDGTATVALGVSGSDAAQIVVRHATIADGAGPGILVFTGARLDAEGVATLSNVEAGVWIESAGTNAVIKTSVVRGTLVDATGDTPSSSGVLIAGGASLTMEDALAEGNQGSGLVIFDPGTNATVRRLLVRGSLPLADDDFGYGVDAEYGATLDLADSAAIANRLVALQISDGGTVVHVDRVLLRGTLPDGQGRRGRGINVQFGAALTVDRTALVDNTQLGVFLFGEMSQAVLSDSLVEGTRTDIGGFGHGVAATTGARTTLSDVTVSESAGVGFFAAGASSLLTHGLIVSNSVGVHVQDGSVLKSVSKAPGEIAPLEVVVTSDTKFVDNATRVGSGGIPLPDPEHATP